MKPWRGKPVLSESLLVEVGYLQKEQGVIFSRRAPCPTSDEGSYQVSCSQLMSMNNYCIYCMVFSTDTQLNAVRLKSAVDMEA